MDFPVGIHVGERLTLDQTWGQAKLAEDSGFESVWVAEGRLARDGIVPAAIIAAKTSRIKIGTGVLNTKSRNAALMAATYKTLDEVSPGRQILGLGAWWEPLASKVGAPVVKPIKNMREYIGVLQTFFANEVVDFEGEFVTMRGVRFDSMYRENRPVDIPIYVGAVGPRMLELSGEIADGVLMDFLLPTSYLEGEGGALDNIAKGVAKRTDGKDGIDLSMIVSCSVDDANPRAAIDACKAFLTLYLMQQPHIGKHCGVDPELVERMKQIAGWPARPDQVDEAMKLVPDELVKRVTACGTTGEVVDRLREYHEAGVRCPVISTLGDKDGTLRALAEALR